jgi:hypothetical protein
MLLFPYIGGIIDDGLGYIVSSLATCHIVEHTEARKYITLDSHIGIMCLVEPTQNLSHIGLGFCVSSMSLGYHLQCVIEGYTLSTSATSCTTGTNAVHPRPVHHGGNFQPHTRRS